MSILKLDSPERMASLEEFSWFDPNKYKGLKEFDLKEWTVLIGDRFVSFVDIWEDKKVVTRDEQTMKDVCAAAPVCNLARMYIR